MTRSSSDTTSIETPSRMARGYRRAAEDEHASIPWVAELDDAQRERRWMSTEDAAAVVDEVELAELIRDFDPGRGTE